MRFLIVTEQRVSDSVATRTNKLWCTGCERKINKGQQVIFVLSKNSRGREKMDECYCLKCDDGEMLHMEIIYEAAEIEAIGIG